MPKTKMTNKKERNWFRARIVGKVFRQPLSVFRYGSKALVLVWNTSPDWRIVTRGDRLCW
jgi:hypothetical protein